MRRLICAFVVRIWRKTHFLIARLICSWIVLFKAGERSRRTTSVLRFAARAGQRALQMVLKGSTEVPGDTRILNQFVKRGSYEKALADFQSIRPMNIKETVSDGVGELSCVLAAADERKGIICVCYRGLRFFILLVEIESDFRIRTIR